MKTPGVFVVKFYYRNPFFHDFFRKVRFLAYSKVEDDVLMSPKPLLKFIIEIFLIKKKTISLSA